MRACADEQGSGQQVDRAELGGDSRLQLNSYSLNVFAVRRQMGSPQAQPLRLGCACESLQLDIDGDVTAITFIQREWTKEAFHPASAPSSNRVAPLRRLHALSERPHELTEARATHCEIRSDEGMGPHACVVVRAPPRWSVAPVEESSRNRPACSAGVHSRV